MMHSKTTTFLHTTQVVARADRRVALRFASSSSTSGMSDLRAGVGAKSKGNQSNMLPLTSLTAVSPLDGRYAKKTRSLREHFSEYALIKKRVEVEVRWAQILCGGEKFAKLDSSSVVALTGQDASSSNKPSASSKKHGIVPELPRLTPEARSALDKMVSEFTLADAERVKEIEKTTNHDVKAVEYFIREKCEADPVLKSLSPVIHFACTSEDVSNLATAMMLKDAVEKVVLPAMDEIIVDLAQRSLACAAIPMLARTHGQPATPTTLGKELAVFAFRLAHHRQSLGDCVVPGKMNGAVGNFAAHVIAMPEVDWPRLSRTFVTRDLGLAWNPYTTQIESHDGMAEIFHATKRFNTALLNFNRDMWQYISMGYFAQKVIAGEVGSSAMPHKTNPIDFENSEGNLGLSNAILGHLADKLPVSRMQRDLSDSTAMRAVGSGFAHAIIAYESTIKGLGRVTPHTENLAQDLDAHWEVLAEPLQTVARRFGASDMYEKLKLATRGKQMGRGEYAGLVADLNVPDDFRGRLARLTPGTYTGLSEHMAERLVDDHLPHAAYVRPVDADDHSEEDAGESDKTESKD